MYPSKKIWKLATWLALKISQPPEQGTESWFVEMNIFNLDLPLSLSLFLITYTVYIYECILYICIEIGEDRGVTLIIRHRNPVTNQPGFREIWSAFASFLVPPLIRWLGELVWRGNPATSGLLHGAGPWDLKHVKAEYLDYQKVNGSVIWHERPVSLYHPLPATLYTRCLTPTNI